MHFQFSIFINKKWNILYSKIIFPGGEKIVTNNGIRGNAHPNHTYTCVRENATEWHPEFYGIIKKLLQNATVFQCKNAPKKLILEVFSCF